MATSREKQRTGSRTPLKPPLRQPLTPMIGSLLRLPHEVVVTRMLAALTLAGFDLTATELGVFLYPGPEGRRPTELARQCNMTRQAMNYVLAGLESKGYLQRRDGANPATRVVSMTKRGWDMVPVIRASVAALEQEWSAQLGARRFNALRDALRDLSLWLGKL